MLSDRSDTIPSGTASLPAELDEKLRVCEAVVERMRVLQEQVDWEIRDMKRVEQASVPHALAAVPALQTAVGTALNWMKQALARH